MMRRMIIGIIIVMHATVAWSQGFDWQYSARYPTESPTRFLGAVISAGYASHTGSLPYLEQDIDMPCCTYDNGAGLPLGFGITYEQWLPSDLAVYGAVGYRLLTANFTAPPTESTPFADGRLLVTQYEYDATLHYMDVNGGIRYRFSGTHLSIGAGLRLQLLVGSDASHLERVISPSDYMFTENPPSKVKEFDVVDVADAAPFVAVPVLTVGYDISIVRGMYLSPLITVGFPMMSTASGATWQTTDIGVLVRLFRSF